MFHVAIGSVLPIENLLMELGEDESSWVEKGAKKSKKAEKKSKKDKRTSKKNKSYKVIPQLKDLLPHVEMPGQMYCLQQFEYLDYPIISIPTPPPEFFS